MMIGILLAVLWVSTGFDGAEELHSRSPLAREEKTVIIAGLKEVWRLEWAEAPTECCMPKDTEEAGIKGDPWQTPYNCGCHGSGYGETASALYLIREAKGQVIDRMKVRGFGESWEDHPPCVPRWPREAKDQERYEGVSQQALRKEIQSRPVVDVMDFGDYDHDGVPAELVLYAGYGGACGLNNFGLIGVSKATGKLQFLGTSEHPDTPLLMRTRERWNELLAAKPGEKTEIRYWSCGDHGAEEEEDFLLWTDRLGIHGEKLWRDCSTRKETRRERL